METSTLRPFNLVQSGNGIYRIWAMSAVQIFALQQYEAIDQEGIISADSVILKPIEISQDWLLKIGFEKIRGWDDIVLWRLHLNGFDLDLEEQMDGSFEFDMAVKIFYVHELQNLIFGITKQNFIKHF